MERIPKRMMIRCLLLLLLAVRFPGVGLSKVIGSSEKGTALASGLSVLSEPHEATVYVDGETKGTTPLQLDDLKPGEHRVTLAKDGYLENSRVLSLKPGQAHIVDVKLTPAAGDSRHMTQIQVEEEGGGSTLKWILPLAAGGGGLAAYLLLRDTNDPPVAGTTSVSPTGPGLAAVTSFSFSSTASDPDNDPLTITWSFGDGSSGSGQNANHIYNTAGTFNATVTVSDGKESVTGSTSVTVRDMTGRWVSLRGSVTRTWTLTQSGTSVDGSYVASHRSGGGRVNGSLSSPRQIRATAKLDCCSPFSFDGTINSAFTQFSGAANGSGFNNTRLTFRRQ